MHRRGESEAVTQGGVRSLTQRRGDDLFDHRPHSKHDRARQQSQAGTDDHSQLSRVPQMRQNELAVTVQYDKQKNAFDCATEHERCGQGAPVSRRAPGEQH